MNMLCCVPLLEEMTQVRVPLPSLGTWKEPGNKLSFPLRGKKFRLKNIYSTCCVRMVT